MKLSVHNDNELTQCDFVHQVSHVHWLGVKPDVHSVKLMNSLIVDTLTTSIFRTHSSLKLEM